MTRTPITRTGWLSFTRVFPPAQNKKSLSDRVHYIGLPDAVSNARSGAPANGRVAAARASRGARRTFAVCLRPLWGRRRRNGAGRAKRIPARRAATLGQLPLVARRRAIVRLEEPEGGLGEQMIVRGEHDPRLGAAPPLRQQVAREARVDKQELPELVDQPGLLPKRRGVGERHAGRRVAPRLPPRPPDIEKLPVGAANRLHVPVPRRDLRVGPRPDAPGRKRLEAPGDAVPVRHGRHERPEVVGRKVDAAGEGRKPHPRELAAQAGTPRAIGGRGHDQQPPRAVPRFGVQLEDPPRGLLDAALAAVRERVVARPPLADWAKPSLSRHAGDGRAHGGRGETELGHQRDQAADPHGAAVVAHVVAEQRKQHGASPHRARPRCRRGGHASGERSRSVAMPCPTPMHIVASPLRAFRRTISCTSVTRMRAPLAPTGCPSAIAPPLGLSRSRSIPRSETHARTWAANASLSSTRSTSPIVHPARASAFCVAGTGPMPMYDGSTAATAPPAMRARGRFPCRSAHAAEATSSAAAPSLMPDELPAVTVPPARNAGGSAARRSSVESGRGCSSVATTVDSPRAPGTVTGVISSANRPSRAAAAARV